jgi:nucleotide-binding universal stress UspA family protein
MASKHPPIIPNQCIALSHSAVYSQFDTFSPAARSTPVNRHLLVAVSDNPRAIHGVRFVSSFFSTKCDLKLTLFAAFPTGPHIWIEEKSYETVTQAETTSSQYEQQFRNSLEAAKMMLTSGGFAADHIETKCVPQSGTRVEDILREGERGMYDAVVLGKRALARLEQIMEESVTEEIIKKDTKMPVWICRSPDEDHSNILLCLDGSAPSYRIADHVGFILGLELRHKVTLLQVQNGRSDQTEAIFSKARTILHENKIADERIEEQVISGFKVAPAILDMARQGKYAAIAVGRTGAGKGLLGRLFIGSVSRELVKGLSSSALWICR